MSESGVHHITRHPEWGSFSNCAIFASRQHKRRDEWNTSSGGDSHPVVVMTCPASIYNCQPYLL